MSILAKLAKISNFSADCSAKVAAKLAKGLPPPTLPNDDSN
jgi:hypothetical protein